MNDGQFGVSLTSSQHETIAGLDSPALTFNEIQLALGLNKNSDFRHADLSGVDFTHADLRGFDLSGTDLRNSYGLAVIWDETTILDGASLQGSMFAYPNSRRRFFEVTENEELFSILKRSDWSQQIAFMFNLGRQSGFDQRTRKFAERLFNETSDTSVRVDMLRVLGFARSSRAEFIEFLIYVCCTSDDTKRVLSVLRAMVDRFRNLENVFLVLYRLTKHSNELVRQLAYEGVLNSTHFWQIKDNVSIDMRQEHNEGVRRAFVAVVSSSVPNAEMIVKADRGATKFLDFREPLTSRFLRRQSDRHNQSLTAVTRIVAELIEAGIPFTFADALVTSSVTNMRLLLVAARAREDR